MKKKISTVKVVATTKVNAKPKKSSMLTKIVEKIVNKKKRLKFLENLIKRRKKGIIKKIKYTKNLLEPGITINEIQERMGFIEYIKSLKNVKEKYEIRKEFEGSKLKDLRSAIPDDMSGRAIFALEANIKRLRNSIKKEVKVINKLFSLAKSKPNVMQAFYENYCKENDMVRFLGQVMTVESFMTVKGGRFALLSDIYTEILKRETKNGNEKIEKERTTEIECKIAHRIGIIIEAWAFSEMMQQRKLADPDGVAREKIRLTNSEKEQVLSGVNMLLSEDENKLKEYLLKMYSNELVEQTKYNIDAIRGIIIILCNFANKADKNGMYKDLTTYERDKALGAYILKNNGKRYNTKEKKTFEEDSLREGMKIIMILKQIMRNDPEYVIQETKVHGESSGILICSIGKRESVESIKNRKLCKGALLMGLHEKRYPTIYVPKDWQYNALGKLSGGYRFNSYCLDELINDGVYKNIIIDYKLVTGVDRGSYLFIKKEMLNVINKMQRTGYRVNWELYDYIKENPWLYQKGENKKGLEIALKTNEEQKKRLIQKHQIQQEQMRLEYVYKIEKLRIKMELNNVYAANNKIEGETTELLEKQQMEIDELENKRSTQAEELGHEQQMKETMRQMDVLRRDMTLANTNIIYFPRVVDFRGRFYEAPSILTPTGNKAVRALLLENIEAYSLTSEMIEDLKISIVRDITKTKANNNEALLMFKKYEQDIIEWKKSKIYLMFDDKYNGLAKCMEFEKSVKNCNYKSNSFISYDATFSGGQVICSFIKDNIIENNNKKIEYKGIPWLRLLKSLNLNSAAEDQSDGAFGDFYEELVKYYYLEKESLIAYKEEIKKKKRKEINDFTREEARKKYINKLKAKIGRNFYEPRDLIINYYEEFLKSDENLILGARQQAPPPMEAGGLGKYLPEKKKPAKTRIEMMGVVEMDQYLSAEIGLCEYILQNKKKLQYIYSQSDFVADLTANDMKAQKQKEKGKLYSYEKISLVEKKKYEASFKNIEALHEYYENLSIEDKIKLIKGLRKDNKAPGMISFYNAGKATFWYKLRESARRNKREKFVSEEHSNYIHENLKNMSLRYEFDKMVEERVLKQKNENASEKGFIVDTEYKTMMVRPLKAYKKTVSVVVGGIRKTKCFSSLTSVVDEQAVIRGRGVNLVHYHDALIVTRVINEWSQVSKGRGILTIHDCFMVPIGFRKNILELYSYALELVRYTLYIPEGYLKMVALLFKFLNMGGSIKGYTSFDVFNKNLDLAVLVDNMTDDEKKEVLEQQFVYNNCLK